jgi:hypothetical protein
VAERGNNDASPLPVKNNFLISGAKNQDTTFNPGGLLLFDEITVIQLV